MKTVPALSPGDTFNPHRAFYGVWIPQWLEEREEVSEKAKKLYAYLTFFAGGQGRAWPSYNTLAEKLHVSRRYVIQLIGELCTHRLIRVTHVNDLAHGHRSNIYEFLWHEWMQHETDREFSMTAPEDTPGEPEITTPSEQQFISPSEPEITPLVNPSSPKENNKKRINNKRIQVGMVGRPIPESKSETASQPDRPTNHLPPSNRSMGHEEWMGILKQNHPDIDIAGELKAFSTHCQRKGSVANRSGFVGWLRKASPAVLLPKPKLRYTY